MNIVKRFYCLPQLPHLLQQKIFSRAIFQPLSLYPLLSRLATSVALFLYHHLSSFHRQKIFLTRQKSFRRIVCWDFFCQGRSFQGEPSAQGYYFLQDCSQSLKLKQGNPLVSIVSSRKLFRMKNLPVFPFLSLSLSLSLFLSLFLSPFLYLFPSPFLCLFHGLWSQILHLIS